VDPMPFQELVQGHALILSVRLRLYHLLKERYTTP
jgi:hypothetical protein